jgi:general nucleoside transport system permease protein
MAAPSASSDQERSDLSSALVSWLVHAGRTLAVPVGSVIFAFIVGGVIVAATGGNPIQAYQDLICGGFGVLCTGNANSAYQISETITFTTPLILTGLAVAISFRAGLFNIGAEGQLVMGAIASTVVGVRFAPWPGWILLPMVLLAGALAGAVWGGIVGVLKAATGAHEVVTTIMLNYVALWLMRYLIVGGPLQAPHGQSASSPVGQGAQLPPLIPASVTFAGFPGGVFRAHTGIFIALAAAYVFAFLLRRMSLGYELRAVGQSQRAARYAGVSVRRTIIVTMLISGAFAGLAGAVQIAGVDHDLIDKYFVDTTGFDAIAVALLGLNAAVGTVLAAFLFGALHAGGSIMQSDAGISSHLVEILQALILFSLAANFLRTLKLRLPVPGRAPGQPATPVLEDAIVGETASAAAAPDAENTA